MESKDYSLDDILDEFGNAPHSGGESVDDILESYSATKSFAESGLQEIFDSRSSSTDIDISDINISMPSDYPSPEEIRRKAKDITQVPDEELSPEDRKKKSRQIDYEIMSGDYERKYIPDELKTSIELQAEQLDKQGEGALIPEAPAAEAPLTDDEAKGAQAEEAAKPAEAAEEQTEPEETEEVTAPPKKRGLFGFLFKKKKADDRFSDDGVSDLKGLHSIYEDEDDFDLKYGDTPLFSEEERDALIGEEHSIPYEIGPEAGRSLSEKMEMEDEYSERYGETKHTARAEKQERKEQANITGEPPIEFGHRPDPVDTENPFDKYSSIDDIEQILTQYDNKQKQRQTRNDTSPLKSFSGIFNKLMAKDENSGGNSELSDKKIKRVSSTVPPIERKRISDVKLDIDGKVLEDTFPRVIPTGDPELDKLNELKARRTRKVESFSPQWEGAEEPAKKEEPETPPPVIEDFESLTDAPSIANHIEQQKNKLVIRLLILVLCFAVTAYIAFANDFSLPILQTIPGIDKKSNPDSFLFINLVLGVIAGIASYQTVSNGIGKLLSLKADCDSLSALALVSSAITGMVALSDTNMIRGSFAFVYVPVAIGSLMFNTIGKLLIISRTQRSFANISGDNEHYALFVCEDEARAQDFTRGALADIPVLACMRKTEVITGFLRSSYSSDSTDRFCRKMSPIILIASTVIAVIAGILARTEHGSLGAFCVGLSSFSAVAAICSCFSIMLVVNLPMERASRSYARKQGAIIGFDSIDEFCDTNCVLADAGQIFPAGSIKLINIKSFPDTSIDEAILQAASLTHQSGSILDSMFYEIIGGKTEMLSHVESYLYEDSMGLCGWINNKRVLLGNRELMQNHSIEGLPSLAKEDEYTKNGRIAVYLSISGQLSAMFIIELTPAYSIGNALRELHKSNIPVMLRSVDSMLTVNRLSELFDVSPSLFKLIPFRYHAQCQETVDFAPRQDATLACSGSFPAFASLVMGANRLRGTISIGIALQAAAIFVGILLVLILVLLGASSQLTVTMALIYNLCFAAVYWIFQLLRKV